jgi:hypothetical protein
MAAVRKIVLTHRGAAKAKYGSSGWSSIRAAVTALAKADASRGITTKFMALDSASDMHRAGAQPVSAPSDAQAIKAAIDGIFLNLQPAYLAILGGPDLVAPVNLANPLWTGNPNDDPDQFVPSDLPYACDASFGLSPADYRAATRVVGRIPDLIGVADPHVLVYQLHIAAAQQPQRRKSPQKVFAVSAKVWQRSTSLSVSGLPDVSSTVQTSPTQGPSWTATQLAPLIHFVNCHGGEFEPNWFGQATPTNWNLPIAIAATRVPASANGMVVAAECCYGAAHWPPSAAAGQPSVALTYLGNGAAAVFGSSTVAYGPATTTNYADDLCRLFVTEVLGGASVGRAVLVARQNYVQAQGMLDPTDLKTLAQFTLLGDPSAVPFVVATPHAMPKSGAAVLNRRAQLDAVGKALSRTTFACHDEPRPRAGITRNRLAELLARPVPERVSVRTFDASSRHAEGAGTMPRAHVAFVPPQGRRPGTLVVVRDPGDGTPEVREVVNR